MHPETFPVPPPSPDIEQRRDLLFAKNYVRLTNMRSRTPGGSREGSLDSSGHFGDISPELAAAMAGVSHVRSPSPGSASFLLLPPLPPFFLLLVLSSILRLTTSMPTVLAGAEGYFCLRPLTQDKEERDEEVDDAFVGEMQLTWVPNESLRQRMRTVDEAPVEAEGERAQGREAPQAQASAYTFPSSVLRHAHVAVRPPLRLTP